MTCYLVDSVTGQVWSASDRDFKDPRIKSRAAMTIEAAERWLVGQWVGRTPDQSEVSVELRADGSLRAKDSDGSEDLEGRWRIVGDRLALTVDDEAITGRMLDDGRLILWQDDDEDDRIVFERVK